MVVREAAIPPSQSIVLIKKMLKVVVSLVNAYFTRITKVASSYLKLLCEFEQILSCL